MAEKLVSGLLPGAEIETNTSSAILEDYIENNWPTIVGSNPNLPLKANIDFGSTPDRTIKPITLKTYTVFSNVATADLGANFFAFDIPVAIDVFVRDLKASAERREPTQLVAIEAYLREFISVNRLGLRNKGINNMNVSNVDYIQEPPDNENDQVWFHLVVTCRIYYHMRRVTI